MRPSTTPDLRIAIILGSTRPGRNGKAVADWVTDKAAARTAAQYELVDLADQSPSAHGPSQFPPSVGQYTGEHTKAWPRRSPPTTAFIFVTPEYNHSTSACSRTRSTTSTPSGTTRRGVRQLRLCWGRPRHRAPSRHLQRAASGTRAPAAELLHVHRLRELLDLRPGPSTPRRHSSCSTSSRSWAECDEDGPRQRMKRCGRSRRALTRAARGDASIRPGNLAHDRAEASIGQASGAGLRQTTQAAATRQAASQTGLVQHRTSSRAAFSNFEPGLSPATT